MGTWCTLGLAVLAPTTRSTLSPTQVPAAADSLLSNSGRWASPHYPHLAFSHLSHPTNAGVGVQSPFGGQRHILASSRCRRLLRLGGLEWHGVGDLGIDRCFHFSPVPLGSLPLPASLHTGFPPRLNAQGQPSLRDGAWEWSEEGRGDGSGEACINTCKFPRKDRFPCKTTCVHHAPHPTPTNTCPASHSPGGHLVGTQNAQPGRATPYL